MPCSPGRRSRFAAHLALLVALAMALLPAAAPRTQAQPPAEDPSAATVQVSVSGVESTDGAVVIRAFREGRDGFPENERDAMASVTAPIAGGAVPEAVLRGLPAGRYVVIAFHDADGDGRLAGSWLGLPSGGLGAHGWDAAEERPSPEDLTFALDAGERRSLNVRLHYR